MKKLLLACTVVGVLVVANPVFAADRATATAWSAAVDSVARLAKSATLQEIVAAISESTMQAIGGERRNPLAPIGIPGAAKPADACQFCPDPPCG